MWVTVSSFGAPPGETEYDRELERALMRMLAAWDVRAVNNTERGGPDERLFGRD